MSDIDTPLELLAGELGAVAGRIERETDLRVTAAVAVLDRRIAEAELRIAMLAASVKDGERGETGQPGEKGLDGTIGPQGPQGERGDPGEKGANGLGGLRGPQGERGDQGADGPAGEPGKLPVVSPWVDKIHYKADAVTYDGSCWQAQRDTGHSPPHEDWICLARGGLDGTPGHGFEVRGTFAADQKYAALDVVVLNGGAFVARRDNPGPCPGDGWQLMASQGKQGKPGEKGPRGDRGERGEAGLSVVGMSVDKDGLVTLVRSDGTVITCDFYPLFSRAMVR